MTVPVTSEDITEPIRLLADIQEATSPEAPDQRNP